MQSERYWIIRFLITFTANCWNNHVTTFTLNLALAVFNLSVKLSSFALASEVRIILHFSRLCIYFSKKTNATLTFAVNAILNLSNESEFWSSNYPVYPNVGFMWNCMSFKVWGVFPSLTISGLPRTQTSLSLCKLRAKEGHPPFFTFPWWLALIQMTIQKINSFKNIFLKGHDVSQQGKSCRPCNKITIKFCDFSLRYN